MARIAWTSEAESWLTDIYSFIAQDSPVAAWRVIRGIVGKVEVLAKYPRLGHRYEDVIDREVRILLFGHYRIAYFIRSENDIDILGVYHGALDISRHLR